MDWWGVIVDALLDTLKLLPFLLLLYILIELIEHNTKVGRAGVLLGRAAPLVGSAVGLLPMCGFSVMAAKLYEHRHVTLGTLLAVFIATSDEAFLVMLLSGDIGWGQKAVSVLAMCGIKLFLGVAVGYLADVFGRRRRALVPLAEGVGQPHAHEHGHAEEDAECGGHTEAGAHGETYTVCEHKHGLKSNLRVYLLSPLLHALKVAAFVLFILSFRASVPSCIALPLFAANTVVGISPATRQMSSLYNAPGSELAHTPKPIAVNKNAIVSISKPTLSKARVRI